MNEGKINKIISLLEEVANGEIDAEVAIRQWPDIDSETDNLIAASWHDLSHFIADDDIRAKDPDYAAYQKNLLLDKAKRIREKYKTGMSKESKGDK